MASKVKVYAPNRAYTGTVGNDPDDLAAFQSGVAEVASDSKLLRYFREAGYGIGSRPDEPAAKLGGDEADVDWPDPHTHRETFGAPLRDAAVDPLPSDFLAPVNAGEAHPHSSKVVAPGIHGVEPAPIRPGEVYVDDVARQEELEKALAEKVLVEGELATSVAETFNAGERAKSGAFEDGNMGPLGLSDPGSVEMGKRAAADVRKAEAAVPTAVEAPAKGAKKAAWVDYAVSRGMTRDEAEDLSIAKIQERFA